MRNRKEKDRRYEKVMRIEAERGEERTKKSYCPFLSFTCPREHLQTLRGLEKQHGTDAKGTYLVYKMMTTQDLIKYTHTDAVLSRVQR